MRRNLLLTVSAYVLTAPAVVLAEPVTLSDLRERGTGLAVERLDLAVGRHRVTEVGRGDERAEADPRGHGGGNPWRLPDDRPARDERARARGAPRTRA